MRSTASSAPCCAWTPPALSAPVCEPMKAMAMVSELAAVGAGGFCDPLSLQPDRAPRAVTAMAAANVIAPDPRYVESLIRILPECQRSSRGAVGTAHCLRCPILEDSELPVKALPQE